MVQNLLLPYHIYHHDDAFFQLFHNKGYPLKNEYVCDTNLNHYIYHHRVMVKNIYNSNKNERKQESIALQ